tara:strand:- start:2198 stop:2716 length:519 start_codon:yes stop_codon:yes gene_type:complete
MSDENRTLGLLAAGAGIGLWWLLRRPSENFTWDELTQTSTGLDNTPSIEDRIRLIYLARQVLQPLRDAAGPLRVTSAFRSKAVNSAVSGAVDSAGNCTSYHCKGLAADLYNDDWTHEELATYLYSRTDLPLAEVIVERHTGHLHLAADLDGAPGKRKFLETPDGATYTTWTP